MIRRSAMTLVLGVLLAGGPSQAATPDWRGPASVPAVTALCATYDLDENLPSEQNALRSERALGALTEAFRTPKISDFGVIDLEVLARTKGADDRLLTTRVRVCRPFEGTVEPAQLPAGVEQVARQARTGWVAYCSAGEPKACRERIVADSRPSTVAKDAEPYLWAAAFPAAGVSYVSLLAEGEARAAELLRLLASNQHRKEKIGAAVLVLELDRADASQIVERGADGALLLSGRQGFELATKGNAVLRPFLVADAPGAPASGGPQASFTTVVFVAWPAGQAPASPSAAQ
jgi:hypothetical protein